MQCNNNDACLYYFSNDDVYIFKPYFAIFKHMIAYVCRLANEVFYKEIYKANKAC